MTIYPTAEQFQVLMASADEGPVVMTNLLRFKPVADEPCAGLEMQWLLATTSDASFGERRSG